jgi:hypothetical protein
MYVTGGIVNTIEGVAGKRGRTCKGAWTVGCKRDQFWVRTIMLWGSPSLNFSRGAPRFFLRCFLLRTLDQIVVFGSAVTLIAHQPPKIPKFCSRYRTILILISLLQKGTKNLPTSI